MTTPFQLPSDYRESLWGDLKRICNLGCEEFRRVVSQFLASSSKSITAEALFADFAKIIEGDESEAVVSSVLVINNVARDRNAEISTVLQYMRIDAENRWDDAILQVWDEIQPVFEELCSAPVVRRVSKAMELSYDYANLFQGAKILTDIRPIFSGQVEDLEIDGAVVSYTLRLHYDNRDGDHSLSITLDESDVIALAEQCDRALLKADASRELFAAKTGLPTAISGGTTES